MGAPEGWIWPPTSVVDGGFLTGGIGCEILGGTKKAVAFPGVFDKSAVHFAFGRDGQGLKNR